MEADTSTLKYRCECGTWGYGYFKPGKGLVIKHHSAKASAGLERGPDEGGPGRWRGHSPNVDLGGPNSGVREPD